MNWFAKMIFDGRGSRKILHPVILGSIPQLRYAGLSKSKQYPLLIVL